ncbi:MAG: hypothetical protein RR502_02865 [Oscillospiraceae bacterium]
MNRTKEKASDFPNGRKIFKEHKKHYDDLEAIKLTRAELKTYYQSQAAAQKPAKAFFKQYDKQNYGSVHDSADMKNLFIAIVVGFLLTPIITTFGELMQTLDFSGAASNTAAILMSISLFLMLVLFLLVLVAPLVIWTVFILSRLNRDKYLNYILPYELRYMEALLRREYGFEAVQKKEGSAQPFCHVAHKSSMLIAVEQIHRRRFSVCFWTRCRRLLERRNYRS